jgi:hypothetical protein
MAGDQMTTSTSSVRTAHESGMQATRDFLHSLGLPGSNLADLPASPKRFPDGAHYRLELPGIQTPTAMSAGLDEAHKRGITVHRITHTIGIMRNTDSELADMARIANDWGVEVVLSVGPRATYDLSPSVHTPEGARIGYRLRGTDQLVRGIEDVKRAVRFGIRGIMCYDEGMLWVLDEMRRAGELPETIHIKVSAHCGHGNPASIKVLERLGADSINPVRDLDAATWAALRAATDLPMDFSTEAPASSGGFYRDYDAPDIVRVAAPVYCKSGGAEMTTHAFPTSADKARDYVRRMELIKRMLDVYAPEAICSQPGPKDLSIPEV